MTNVELLMILDNGRNYGMTWREIAGNPEDTSASLLIRRHLLARRIKRYKARNSEGKIVYRYQITEQGRRRLYWYRDNRPEYFQQAAERLKARQ